MTTAVLKGLPEKMYVVMEVLHWSNGATAIDYHGPYDKKSTAKAVLSQKKKRGDRSNRISTIRIELELLTTTTNWSNSDI